MFVVSYLECLGCIWQLKPSVLTSKKVDRDQSKDVFVLWSSWNHPRAVLQQEKHLKYSPDELAIRLTVNGIRCIHMRIFFFTHVSRWDVTYFYFGTESSDLKFNFHGIRWRSGTQTGRQWSFGRWNFNPSAWEWPSFTQLRIQNKIGCQERKGSSTMLQFTFIIRHDRNDQVAHTLNAGVLVKATRKLIFWPPFYKNWHNFQSEIRRLNEDKWPT